MYLFPVSMRCIRSSRSLGSSLQFQCQRCKQSPAAHNMCSSIQCWLPKLCLFFGRRKPSRRGRQSGRQQCHIWRPPSCVQHANRTCSIITNQSAVVVSDIAELGDLWVTQLYLPHMHDYCWQPTACSLLLDMQQYIHRWILIRMFSQDSMQHIWEAESSKQL